LLWPRGRSHRSGREDGHTAVAARTVTP
jgi:hypothetical protein